MTAHLEEPKGSEQVYDAIIAGGSFAGLAAAARLRGKRVLLVEPHEIGAVQTSACGTLLSVIEATQTQASLLQIHKDLVVHLPGRDLVFPLPYPFCTFDYRIFCQCLLAQGDAEIVRGMVTGRQGKRVITNRGEYQAKVLIDATGWRAALATNLQTQAAPHRGKSFGLETIIPLTYRDLHLYYDPHRLQPYNVGWLFPAGAVSRAGFASYRGQTRLNEPLISFVKGTFSQPPDGRHGGYFPYRRKPATSGPVFRLGDSAGQCLPFTGEGIRPALYFGSMVGNLARQVIDGQLSEAQALATYRMAVERRKAPFYNLLAVQKLLPGLPMALIKGVSRILQNPRVLNTILIAYYRSFDPGEIARKA